MVPVDDALVRALVFLWGKTQRGRLAASAAYRREGISSRSNSPLRKERHDDRATQYNNEVHSVRTPVGKMILAQTRFICCHNHLRRVPTHYWVTLKLS